MSKPIFCCKIKYCHYQTTINRNGKKNGKYREETFFNQLRRGSWYDRQHGEYFKKITVGRSWNTSYRLQENRDPEPTLDGYKVIRNGWRSEMIEVKASMEGTRNFQNRKRDYPNTGYMYFPSLSNTQYNKLIDKQGRIYLLVGDNKAKLLDVYSINSRKIIQQMVTKTQYRSIVGQHYGDT